jgi:nucleoside-diphosphate-sugar epimerase
VTGGAGFIGSHIAEELVRRGQEVRVIDNLSTGSEYNIQHLLRDIEFIHGDLRDPKVASTATVGVEYVIHQAAIPSVPRSIEDPGGVTESNVNGTLNLLIAARDSGVRRVVYASSSSVYGDTPTLPKHEDMQPTPLSPYAASKLAAEYYCTVFSHVYGLETVSLRYFNVFGPRQDPFSPYAAVIARFVEAVLAQNALVIYGDGEQTRDFTYVSNVVEANLLACHAPAAAGEVINIGGGGRTSLNQLVEELRQVVNDDLIVHYDAPRPGDVLHSQAGIEKARQLLGWTAKVGLTEGLQKTMVWFRDRG